ncbi:MAG: MobV family relaxase [Cyanobacteria bacterium P01_D01_bin.50]
MAYAIARVAKLKKANMVGSGAHTSRSKDTPNADPTKQNVRFIGDTNSSENLERIVLDKINQHKQKRKIRTDAVYCVEILLTASPEYFRPQDPTLGGYYEEDKVQSWLEASKKWLIEQYDDRVVRAELHLDEMTPHIHAYFVPLDEKGQLRCNHFFNGRQKMRAFQDSYHDAVAHLGLERGIKGSLAKHQDIKDFYRIVEEGKDLEVNRLNQAQIKTKAVDRRIAEQKKSEMEATAKRLARDNEELQKRIIELEQSNQQLRYQLNRTVNQLRDLPLDDVAWHLGLIHDIKGTNRWKGHDCIINIDDSKFHDFAPGKNKGGGGAIDLVMHVNGCNFKQAIAWLNDRFGEEGMQRTVTHHAKIRASEIVEKEPAPQFIQPRASESQWDAVYNYLTIKRGLPENLVDYLHEQGIVYADEHQNAVFAMRSLEIGDINKLGLWTKNTPTPIVGAFLRGTRGENNSFMGYTIGTKRNQGWFYVGSGGQADSPIQRVVLCKSPIDALSYLTLESQVLGKAPQQKTIFLVSDSTFNLPVTLLKDIPEVVAAYDNDSAGNQLSRDIQKLLPQTTIKQPSATDWNQELLELIRRLRLERSAKQKKILGFER